MTVKVAHRPARVTTPLAVPEPETLAAPPTMPDGHVGGTTVQSLLPVVGALSSVTMIVVLRNSNPLFLVAGAVLLVVALVAALGMALSQRGGAARSRRIQRERYLDYLEMVRGRLRAQGRHVRAAAHLLDPAPVALPALVRDLARLWERRRTNADFLHVRIGAGDLPWFGLTVPPESDPVQPYDPIMRGEAQALVTHYSVVQDLAVTVDLDSAGQVAVIGGRDGVLAVARAMILQLATWHSPDDLLLAASFPEQAAQDWRGFDLLPHVVDARLLDGPVPARRIAPDLARLAQVLGVELADRVQTAATAKRSVGRVDRVSSPRLVVFCDDHGQIASALPALDADLDLADLAVTTVHLLSDRLHEPSDVTLRVVVEPADPGEQPRAHVTDRRRALAPGADPSAIELAGSRFDGVRIDQPSAALFESTARALAPLRPARVRVDEPDSTASLGVTELLGISSVADVGPGRWVPRSARDFFRVPIGLDDAGAPVLLDLKESAELGMGPHGICIGATGSGKSETLRTLVLALALSHPPEDLSLVLVDYKGGAAFAPFEELPHVAGIIDNLADDPQLIERARTSIAGEVVRRQEMLRDAGSLPSIGHYRALRDEHPDLAPMPHLLVVIDEFGELLSAEPEFVDLLVSIGRIGRSIGVHLLLSSQRIEPGRLRGLDTYLSYRIGLRTFSAAESAVVLDTPDAFTLPAVPGYAYLKVDTTIYRRFRSGYVSGPADPSLLPVPHPPEESVGPLLLPLYNGLADAQNGTAEECLLPPTTQRPLVSECVDRLRPARGSTGRVVPPVWLPPLPDRLALGRVLDHDRPTGQSGLRLSVGLVDDPSRQQQRPWVVDLSRAGGHLAVIGAPGTGRSTFLRTVAASLALTHTPREVSVYGMDLTGGGLRRIEGFPHVGGVATRTQRDRLTRLLDEVSAMLTRREAVFREREIDSVAQLRERHAAGLVPELESAEVVLLVDGFAQLRTDFDELEDRMGDLLQRGGSFGIHVVAALTRWNDVRMAQQPLIGTRCELRLNDPVDSLLGRKLNATLRTDQPGRLLTEDRLLAQVALPVLDDTLDTDLGTALEHLARRCADSWSGPGAAPIRLLPTSLSRHELPGGSATPDAVPFGLHQESMAVATLQLDGLDQHLLVLGDQGSGKSTTLRTVLAGLVDQHRPEDLVVAVMAVRDDIAGDVGEDYLGGHATSSAQARQLSEAIAAELTLRLERSDRSRQPSAVGPRIVVVVDDFDILGSGRADPLGPLLAFLPSARDLRFHVLLSRPVTGAVRAMYDLTLQTMRDTGASLLLLSGERSEGQIVPGVYAEAMVPGRGRFVRRGRPASVVQVVHSQPVQAPERQAS